MYEGRAMFDDLERLRQIPGLRELLAHYAALADNGREVWQDRLMSLDGVDSSALSKLHGELIAWGWIELNAGCFGMSKAGAVAGFYRVTTTGLRVLRRAAADHDESDGDEMVPETADTEKVTSIEASVVESDSSGVRAACNPDDTQFSSAEVEPTAPAAPKQAA
jgi:hypothetical protein